MRYLGVVEISGVLHAISGGGGGVPMFPGISRGV